MMKKTPNTLFCFRSENWGEVWMKLSGVWGCSNPHDKRTCFIWYEILNHREEETQEKQTDIKMHVWRLFRSPFSAQYYCANLTRKKINVQNSKFSCQKKVEAPHTESEGND